jgi:tetratricopeptide (TPR) repeat protein
VRSGNVSPKAGETPFVQKSAPFVTNRHGDWSERDTVSSEGIRMTFVTWLLMALMVAAGQRPAAERFDLTVRGDFFAGFAGDETRLKKGMDACEQALSDNPKHAEALVWHGSGLAFQAGMAFQKGDMKTGGELWQHGMEEMNTAVTLEPDNVGVRIPRGAVLFQASLNMQPPMARALLETAIADYEHVLERQAPYFDTLGDHPKGELLFGLAEGYSRLGQPEKARMYFERLVKDAPASGQTPKAKQWLTDGTLPKSRGLGCVGCHK